MNSAQLAQFVGSVRSRQVEGSLSTDIRKFVGEGSESRNHFLCMPTAVHCFDQLVVEALIREENGALASHSRNRRVDIGRRGEQQVFNHVNFKSQTEKTETGLKDADIGFATGNDGLPLM